MSGAKLKALTEWLQQKPEDRSLTITATSTGLIRVHVHERGMKRGETITHKERARIDKVLEAVAKKVTP